jgi:hypothetical protein
MPKALFSAIAQRRYLSAVLYTLVIIIITAQCYLLGTGLYRNDGVHYAHYKNFLIFRQSFFHLVQHTNLYALYPDLDLDYFKYSPTFALLMAPFSILPDFFGLLLWNLLNGLVLFWGIYHLPMIRNKHRLFIVLFILIELITALQNSQSNSLIAGLIIMAFVFCERKNVAMATLCIVLSVFIKVFGLVAFAIFIFYPNKKKVILFTAIWSIVLLLLPLIVNSPSQLYWQYQNWLHLLHMDYSASLGLSAEGLLHNWFGIRAKNLVILLGVILFCLPLLKFRLFSDTRFKLNFLASILIWIVIFNHKAESPTFIIAVTGVAIWFSTQRRSTGNQLLLLLVFILTILSPTDLFPRYIREHYVIPYDLKVLPCILVWLKLIADMMRYKPARIHAVSMEQSGMIAGS